MVCRLKSIPQREREREGGGGLKIMKILQVGK